MLAISDFELDGSGGGVISFFYPESLTALLMPSPTATAPITITTAIATLIIVQVLLLLILAFCVNLKAGHMLQGSRETGSIDRRCIGRVPVPGGVEAESVDCIVIKMCPSPVPFGPDGDLLLLPSTIKAAGGYCGSLTGTAGNGPIGGGDGGGDSEGDKEHLAVLPFKLLCF